MSRIFHGVIPGRPPSVRRQIPRLHGLQELPAHGDLRILQAELRIPWLKLHQKPGSLVWSLNELCVLLDLRKDVIARGAYRAAYRPAMTSSWTILAGLEILSC